MDYISEGRKILVLEAQALIEVANNLDNNFGKAVELLRECQGRVIITGVGKSGIIGRKIASTLSSTGTPAFFIHSSEALHGDLGKITHHDIVILISNSGETNEIISIMPNLKLLGVPIIGITGDCDSTIGQKCDIRINVNVKGEADPNDLAPTCSTTAVLAVGDALAMTLVKLKSFLPEQFAFIHPGGSLGKKLTLTVEDLMFKGDKVPTLIKSATIKEAIFKFTKMGLGIVAVINEEGILQGVFTDGDLRRLIEKEPNFINIQIDQVMNTRTKTVFKSVLAFEALKMMEKFRITALIVIEENNKVIGVLNLHDVLKAGIT